MEVSDAKRLRELESENAKLKKLLAKQINERWSMDFVSDGLANGMRFRALNIVDDFSRECPAIEADASLPGARADTRGLPNGIVVDNGPN